MNKISLEFLTISNLPLSFVYLGSTIILLCLLFYWNHSNIYIFIICKGLFDIEEVDHWTAKVVSAGSLKDKFNNYTLVSLFCLLVDSQINVGHIIETLKKE